MRQYNLDPTNFIERLLKCFNNPTTDVEIRRLISALFFSIFNYWMEKTGHNNADPKDFVKWVNRNLPRYREEIKFLRDVRNAVDHYVCKNVELQHYPYLTININKGTFEKVKQKSLQLLSELKKI